MSAEQQRRDEVKIDRGTLRHGPGHSWLVDGTLIEFDAILEYPEYGTVEFVPRATIEAAAPSVIGVPFTIEHEVRSVTPDNWRDVSHGIVTDSRITDTGHDITIQITTREGLEAIRSDARWLSPAYDHRTEADPGIRTDGRRYTHVQRARRYDNVTATATPRAGKSAALKLDSAAPRGQIMPTLKHGTTTHTITQTQADALRWQGHQHAEAVKAKKADAIKTATISITMGTDTVELVLPESTVQGILDQLGATKSEEPPDAEASGAMEMPMDSAPAKTDAAKPKAEQAKPLTQALLDEAIKAVKADAAAQHAATVAAQRAQPFVGDRSLAGLSEGDVILAVFGLRADAKTALPRVQQLVRQAGDVKTDAEARAVARGRLAAMFDSELERLQGEAAKAKRTDSADDLADLWAPKADKADAKPLEGIAAQADKARAARYQRNHDESRGIKPAAAR